jgi:hypothetical protein
MTTSFIIHYQGWQAEFNPNCRVRTSRPCQCNPSFVLVAVIRAEPANTLGDRRSNFQACSLSKNNADNTAARCGCSTRRERFSLFWALSENL